MATLYGQKHIKAWHTNFPCTSPPSLKRPLLLISHLLSYLPFLTCSESEKADLERALQFRDFSSGYFSIQSTRPQSLGYGSTDSLVGLLDWIYELAASVAGAEPFEDDECLTWISIYYLSRTGPAASLRIYCEVVQSHGANLLGKMEPTTIPLGHSCFPRNAVILPRGYDLTSLGRPRTCSPPLYSWHRGSNLVLNLSTRMGVILPPLRTERADWRSEENVWYGSVCVRGR